MTTEFTKENESCIGYIMHNQTYGVIFKNKTQILSNYQQKNLVYINCEGEKIKLEYKFYKEGLYPLKIQTRIRKFAYYENILQKTNLL